MKSFKEVKANMDEDSTSALMSTRKFLKLWEDGVISSYDGVGDLHDGNEFITNGFETDIFEFIRNVAPTMTKTEFIRKYPYVAWYNK